MNTRKGIRCGRTSRCRARAGATHSNFSTSGRAEMSPARKPTFEDQRTTIYKVDPTHPETGDLPILRTEELLLNMGPQHPSTHGVLKVILELEGERITKATPVMGFLHRGVEKLAEDGTYHQFIPHTDRLDYICAMYNNFAYCRAVEKLMNITVPERAEYLRTIV